MHQGPGALAPSPHTELTAATVAMSNCRQQAWCKQGTPPRDEKDSGLGSHSHHIPDHTTAEQETSPSILWLAEQTQSS